jgi:hypothetical protein
MDILKIFWTFGKFYDHLVHFVLIRQIFPVLVSQTKKNLATLWPQTAENRSLVVVERSNKCCFLVITLFSLLQCKMKSVSDLEVLRIYFWQPKSHCAFALSKQLDGNAASLVVKNILSSHLSESR